MFAYMVAWQHQHFYGIRWIYFDDYNKGGFKMEMSKNRAMIISIVTLVVAILAVNAVFIR
jgi:heme O synthase-like polyprenyltransferase